MMPLGVMYILEHYLIAQRRVVFAYIFMLGMPIQLWYSWNFIDEPLDLVMVTAVSGVCLTIVGIIVMLVSTPSSDGVITGENS